MPGSLVGRLGLVSLGDLGRWSGGEVFAVPTFKIELTIRTLFPKRSY